MYNGLKYYIYVPENVNSETKTEIYHHGWGTDNTSEFGIHSSHYGNNIVIMTDYKDYKGWPKLTVEFVEIVEKQFNIENNGITIAGWSDGGYPAIQTTIEYIKKNPDTPPQTLFMIDDWNNTTGIKNVQSILSDGGKEALQENNAVIFLFVNAAALENDLLNGNYTANAKTQEIGELARNGINTIVVLCDNAGHEQMRDKLFTEGYYDYAAGNGSIPTNNCRYLMYNEATDRYEYVEPSAIETLEKLHDTFGKDDYLEKINQLASLENSSVSNLLVISNKNILENQVNNVLSKIKNTSFVQKKLNFDTNFSSTSNIPSQIPSIIQQYFSLNADLLIKLMNDMKLISYYGETLENTNQELKTIASQLNSNNIV